MPKWTAQDMPDQTGRTAIVTGANSGLGYETALALARKGAHVVMAIRNLEKGQQAHDDIRKQVPNASLRMMKLDLSSLESVRSFARDFQQQYSQLDLLINNAGVMATPYSHTKDGFEMQFGVNHLGHFALTGLLMEMLIATPGSRVVTVTSTANYIGSIHFDDLQLKNNYSRYGAYGQSKLANVMFTFELQRRLQAAGVQTVALTAHPGLSSTNLQSNTANTNNSPLEMALYTLAHATISQNQTMGALPQLYAATAPEAKPGAFYGPHFLATRGYPKEVRANRKAYNEADARRLWEMSEKLTGVTYDALEKQPARYA
ncbi:MAG: SDR family NAD(P)-dependent oxidoreductase [Anaerolineae bacterium]